MDLLPFYWLKSFPAIYAHIFSVFNTCNLAVICYVHRPGIGQAQYRLFPNSAALNNLPNIIGLDISEGIKDSYTILEHYSLQTDITKPNTVSILG